MADIKNFWLSETEKQIKQIANTPTTQTASRTSAQFMEDIQKTMNDWTYSTQDEAIRWVLEYANSKSVTYEGIDTESIFLQLDDKISSPWLLEQTWDVLTWVKETVEEPLEEIKEGVFNIWRDVISLAKWDIKNAPWLIGDFARATRKWADRITELNKSIDETGWTAGDKAIWFGLNIFGEIVDFWGEVIMAGIKTIAPESLEQVTEEGIKDFAQSEFGQDVIWFAQEAWDKWEQFKESSPEANRFWLSIESVLPVAEVAVWWFGGKLSKEIGWELIETWIKKGWKLIQSWKEILEEWVEWLKEWVTKLKESIPQTPSKIFWEKPSSFAENIAWIDEQTKNILKEVTTEDFDRFVQAGKDATTNIKNPTPLEIAWDEASDTLKLITNAKRAAWANKSQILKNIETKTIETQPILDDFTSFIEERFNLRLDDNLKLVEISGKKANIWDASIADVQWMADELLDLFTQKDINLWNLDATVDRIQDSLWARVLDRWAWGKASSTEKQISSFLEWKLNQRLKSVAWDEFIDANLDFRRLLDMETRLAKALGKEWERGWSLMKTVFSPQTWQKTKELFRKIEEEFGIDLTTKAWLAKFSMQLSGDPRQANLLEALDLWTWFTSKLQQKFQWTLVSPVIEWAEALLKKWFSPERVGRWLTK